MTEQMVVETIPQTYYSTAKIENKKRKEETKVTHLQSAWYSSPSMKCEYPIYSVYNLGWVGEREVAYACLLFSR